MPKVSVLMSVYDDANYLQAALESLAVQTLEDFECIVVDDAAKPETGWIVEQFCAQDPRFKVLKNQTNKGLGESLNLALAVATGQYIARMDGDDICLPTRFEKQVAYLDNHPDVTVVGTWATIIDAKGTPTGTRKYATKHADLMKLLWACPLLHPTVMMRADALKALDGYPPLRRRQDYALWFKAAKAGWIFATMDEELLLYRITQTHFGKMKPSLAWQQLKVGFAGYAGMGGLNPMVYAAIAYPFIRSLLPLKLQRGLAKAVQWLDPRRKSAAE